jgi:hypothetical protein
MWIVSGHDVTEGHFDHGIDHPDNHSTDEHSTDEHDELANTNNGPTNHGSGVGRPLYVRSTVSDDWLLPRGCRHRVLAAGLHEYQL